MCGWLLSDIKSLKNMCWLVSTETIFLCDKNSYIGIHTGGPLIGDQMLEI